MQEKGSVTALLRQVQENLAGLSTAIGELADQVELDQSAHRPDFLTEEQMAVHLGITKRAIQSKRYRGTIPSGIWQKVGGHYVYSLQRYEDWLEGLWASKRLVIPDETVKISASNKRRPPRNSVYLLT